MIPEVVSHPLANGIDSPERISHLNEIIRRKPALREFYRQVYDIFSASLNSCPKEGVALELGSGASFAKEVIPDLTTSDVIAYDGVDQIVDAQDMQFENQSLRSIFLMNVLHHIPDAEQFFFEAQRCVKCGGQIVIFDQYPGFIARPILRFFHHEMFDDKVESWKFESTGPLSSANGAQAWNIFFRDRRRFDQMFPFLKVEEITFHAPLLYWLSGGLKAWTLAPEILLPAISLFDKFLLRLNKNFASFVVIKISRKETV